ncbi:hypothetical protein [Streptomyces sp. CT34]|uniref:hypothetical protein n=1 Tax=Streptomyces sp. CT34 TaxID=1553907 RepID=UPI0007C7D01E|nr:hypothetical protein [Streptomyces sp. CT34]
MPRKEPRRRRIGWALTVSACIVSAVAGWVAWDHSHIHEAAVRGDVLMSSDGRTLTTPVDWSSCEDKPNLQAHEAARTITLVLTRKRHPFVSENTVCDDPHDGLVSTALSKPAGDRDITDSVTHSTITPFNGSHLDRPHYLPHGYTQTDTVIAPGNRSNPPYVRARKPAWTTTYQRNLDKGGQAGYVSISETAGETSITAGTPVVIDGHPARFQQHARGSRSVTWSESGYTITVEAGDPLMSQDEFLHIARQLNR